MGVAADVNVAAARTAIALDNIIKKYLEGADSKSLLCLESKERKE